MTGNKVFIYIIRSDLLILDLFSNAFDGINNFFPTAVTHRNIQLKSIMILSHFFSFFNFRNHFFRQVFSLANDLDLHPLSTNNRVYLILFKLP